MKNKQWGKQLAVVLVNWRKEAETCEQVLELRHWKQIKPLILVVDNESTSDSERSLANFLQTEILLTSPINRGFGGGNNIGIQEAMNHDAKHILLLNTDAKIGEEEVLKLLDTLESDKQIFSIGPLLKEGDEKKITEYVGGKDIGIYPNTRLKKIEWERRKLKHYSKQDSEGQTVETDYTIGAIILLNAEKLKEVGLFDENFFFSGEVADLCYRAALKKYTSNTRLDALGYHFTNQTAATMRNSLYLYYNVRNRFLYVKKHTYGWRTRLFWYIFAVRSLVGFLLNRQFQSARAVCLAVGHGTGNQFGNQNHYFVKSNS